MIDFIVSNLSVILAVVVGLALLVLELLTPGFGVAGFSGLAALFVSVVLVWMSGGALAGMGMLLCVVALVALFIAIALKSAATGRISRSALILKAATGKEEGYSSAEDLSQYLGKVGQTQTVLRPSGFATFDGIRLQVVTDGQFIDPGTAVRVLAVEGARVLVSTLES